MRTEQRGPARRLPRFAYFGLAACLALSATVVARPPQPKPPPPSPMAEPLRLINWARAAYGLVNDYTCVLTKRERINGVLTPEHVTVFMFKKQPFSVYMHWSAPHDLAGQEVCYVAGRHGNRMRVKPRGLLSALGWLTLETTDPRVRRTTQHDIREAGIGNLLEQFARGWEEERRLGQTLVRIAPYEKNNRRGTRVETIHPTNGGGKLLHYRDVLYFDAETHLLVRFECYDWPHQPGGTGEMIEVFDYGNLKANVGLRDHVFNK